MPGIYKIKYKLFKSGEMNTYKCSNGNRYNQLQIDRRIRIAKETKLEFQRDRLGYNVCERCRRNDCVPIDVSHNVSVKKAKEMGKTELCWDILNLEILGRKCHQKKDKLNLQFNG